MQELVFFSITLGQDVAIQNKHLAGCQIFMAECNNLSLI